MWANATNAIETVTRMKLETVSETLLETYNANSFNVLSGRVVKMPLGNGSYQIQATITPYGADEHGKMAAFYMLRAFNLMTVGVPPLQCT